MIFALLSFYVPLLILISEAYSASPNGELRLQGFNFDWTSKSQFKNKTHLILATQTRSAAQKYYVEIKMVDLRENSVIKSTLVGNSTEENFRPHIIVVQQSIYVAFISQNGYGLKLKVAILDFEFNPKGDPLVIGTPLDQVKQDQYYKHIYLTLLDKNTIAILWHSYDRKYQWNHREISVLDNSITSTIVLPDSEKVSAVKNSLGVRVFAQIKQNQLYLIKQLQRDLQLHVQLYIMNQCVIPNINPIDLRISDEQLRKGKPKLLIIENEVILIYGLYGQSTSYLKIKKLSSIGEVQMETNLIRDSSQLRDYDITFGNDDLQFRLLVRWFEGGFDKINEYLMKLQDLTLVEQSIFMEKMTPDIQGDQILIQKNYRFGVQRIYYFYLVKSSATFFELNYQIKSAVYQQTVNLGNFQFDGLQLHSVVNQNTIYLQIQSNSDLQVFSSLDDILVPIQNFQFHQVELIFQRQLFFDQSNFFQIALDQYNNFQLYLNVATVPQKLQITQTSRNPRLGCVEFAGISHIFVAWLGISNVEIAQQIEQVYLQRISLKTYSIENFEKVICSNNCLDCNDEGKCLQCKNEQYQLIDGKCILMCSNNCDQCAIENQCLVCQTTYFMNSTLQCIKDESNYITSIDNLTQMNLFYSNQNLITVYFKQNSTRLEVILEEFDNQIPISGEIRISTNDDMIVPKKPQVIKKGFYYFVTYLTQLQADKYQRVLVILNEAYQLCSRNFLNYAETVESDIFITNSLNIYCFSLVLDGVNQYLRLSFYKFENGQIALQKWWQGDNEFNDGNNLKNIRFANTQKSNFILLLFSSIKDDVEIDHFATFDEGLQILSKSARHSYLEYSQNGWTVLYDLIKGKQIKLQFYNQNQILQSEYLIGSLNKIFSCLLQVNDNFVYLAYLQQDASTQLTIIILNQYTLNGQDQKQIQINTNEKYIRDLSMGINNQFIQFSWTSNQFNKSYRALLNQDLQQIPLNSQVCKDNCKKCDENQQCIICYPGFSLELSICKPICSDNCQQCTIPYTCDYCLGNLKYIDNNCQDISKLKLEQSICSETCYGVAQTLQFDDNNVIVTYQDYNQTQYSIKVKSYKVNNSSATSIQSIITQTQAIYYHKLFQYNKGKFVLVWLSGNCSIQCRLMMQLFNQDLSQINSQKEIKSLMTDISLFNLQISNYYQQEYYPFYLVWCELDQNQLTSIIVGKFEVNQVNSQPSINLIVEQNFNEISKMPQLIAVQYDSYKVCYLANQNTIKLMNKNLYTNTVTYKELYKTANKIIGLSVVRYLYYYYTVAAWIEIAQDQLPTIQYQLKTQLYDSEMNKIGTQQILPTNNRQIDNVLLTIYSNDYLTLYYVERGLDNNLRIKYFFISSIWQIPGGFSNKNSQTVNIVSHFKHNNLFNAYQSDYSKNFITFEGELDNKKQMFIQETQSTNNFLSKCPDNCFYCDSNNKCILCIQGYEIQQNNCVQKLPDFCNVGSLGKCTQCSAGYDVTTSGLCSLSDPQYKAIKLNTYSLLNKQRLSSFKNGNIIVVWYRLYYQSEGTGIYMSLYNVHGDRLIDETRISLTPEGIQIFPDVQVLQTDEVVCVWFDGDLEIGAQIKMSRFTNTLTRIGEEIIVKDDIKLTSVIDTPLMIQSIINGFVIVWTETVSLTNHLFINFYDNEANFLKSWQLNNDDQIRNFEPVVASNSQIIVVLWCSQTSTSNTQIRITSFSLNHVFIDSQILSENGEAPAADVLNDESFIFAWKETYIGQDEIMSRKIVYKKYSSDLGQQYYKNFLGESDFNQNNPDVIHTNQGYAIIYENFYQANSDIRNLKMQFFNLNGETTNPLITVTNQQGQYPHHPQLTQLPQGQFIASYIQSPIIQYSLNDDVYIKRYDSNGDQLLLSTIVCSSNCKICQTSQSCKQCIFGYMLFNWQCQKEIANCKTYSSDTGQCTECNQNYILVSKTCKFSNKQLDYSIEIKNNIKSSPKSVVFADGVIGQFWHLNNAVWFQKFNSQGFKMSVQLIITKVTFNKILFFDILVIDENNYLLALLDLGTVYVKICSYTYNYYYNCQNQYSTTGVQNNEINRNTNNIVVQLNKIDVSTVGLFFLSKNQNVISLKMQLLIIQSDSNNQIYISTFANPIQLVSQGELEYLTTDNLDVQIQNGHISVLKPVPKSNIIAYLYQIYDQQGHIISTLRIPINTKRIDFTLLQISPTLFIEAWTQLESLSYEVFYQFKQFDGVQIADPVKVSNSEEKYKFDIKLVNLKKITVLSWREGESSIDIVRNTKFKAAIISQKTGLAQVIDLNYSPQNSTLGIVQLQNQDIVFSFIVVDGVFLSTVKSVKFSPEGEQLIFSAPRCNYGCQQCDSRLICLKCYDSYNYILTTQGTCIDKKSDCLNYDSNCWECQTGYYMSIYRTCELITQIMETKLLKDGYQPYPFNVAYYPDGKFIIVYVKGTYLEAVVYSSSGSILLQPFSIFTISSDYKGYLIKEISILIYPDQTVSLFNMYSIDKINVGCYYTHVLISSDFNMMEEEIILYGDSELAYSDHVELLVKQLTLNSVGFMIKTRSQVYFALYKNQFQSAIANVQEDFTNFSSQNVDMDFVQTSNNIIIAYTTNSETSIINIYDLSLIFIKNITINDGQLIKAAVNSRDQVVIVTRFQISFIEQNTLIRESYQDNDLYPVAILINSEDQIQVLSYTSQIAYPLIIFFFNNQGYLFYERQVNMNSKITQVKTLNLLYNDQINIFYEGRMSFQSGKSLYIARFDQFGNSKNIMDIICPKNCLACTSSNKCQQCTDGYQRDEQTLLCSKICTVIGCKSCETTQCDRCQDQMQLLSGKCISVNNNPMKNELQIIYECSETTKQKIIKFSNTDYALVYSCQNQITIKRYTKDNIEVLSNTKIFDDQLFDFDVTVVFDVIYIIAVGIGKQNQAQIYKFNQTWTYVSVITFTSQITQVIIIGLPFHYSIFLSGDIQQKFDNIKMTCFGSSFYSYDTNDIKIYEQIQYNPPQNIQDCNRNKIKSVTSFGQLIYVVSNEQNGIKIATLSYFGPISFQMIQMPYQEEIYFNTNSVEFVIISRFRGARVWNLYIYDMAFTILYFNEQFMEGDILFSLAITDVSVMIAFRNKDYASIVQYQILDKKGSLTGQGYIANTAISKSSFLIQLSETLVGFSWLGIKMQQKVSLSFAVVDQTGQFVQYIISCSENCESCINAIWCTKCQEGYFKAQNLEKKSQFCLSQPAESYCLSFSYEGQCVNCAESYILEQTKCVLDQTEKNTIIINQEKTYNQIQPNGVTFKDGSLLVVWASMNQDGDSWGIYAQLHNNQGEKIGDNLRINQNTIGPQQSPRIALLIDNTVLIIYIDGDTSNSAVIRGVIYNNQLVRISPYYEFAQFSFLIKNIQRNYILNIKALQNGGFVVGYIENKNNLEDQITLLFYDQNYNQVSKQSIIQLQEINFQFELSSTFSTLAVLSLQGDHKFSVHLYSFDGKLQNTVSTFNELSMSVVKSINSANQYYGIVQTVQFASQCKLFFQLYSDQFLSYGNPIIIDTISLDRYQSIGHVQMGSYNQGFLISIQIKQLDQSSSFLKQYFVNLNWEVSKLENTDNYYLNNEESSMGFTYIGTPYQHYFVVWQLLYNPDLYNIALKKYSKLGIQQSIYDTTCSNSCLKCEINEICSTCLDQYLPTQSFCKPICEEYCSECLIPSFCLICLSGFIQQIEGKCSPLEIDQFQPEIFLTLSNSENILDLELIQDQIVIYSSQRENIKLSLMKDYKLQKQVLVDIVYDSHRRKILTFYVDDNFIVVLYYVDKIIVQRFNLLGSKLLDQQLKIPLIINNYLSIVIEPLENNQYSIIYANKTNQNLNVYHAIFDGQYNFMNDFKLILTSLDDDISYQTKNTLITSKYIIFRDQVKLFYLIYNQLNKQTSKGIFQLQNNNYVEIIKRWGIPDKDHLYVSTIYYHLLDINYIPLTQMTKVIENNQLNEKLINLFVFEDSFTVLVEQISFQNQNSAQLIAQRFDNSGAKIGSYYKIDQHDSALFRKAVQQWNYYLMIWLQIDSLTGNKTIIAKKFDKNGKQLEMNCVANCIQCSNSQYCEVCDQNYSLDDNYQCKLICPNNCNTCIVYNQCQICNQGFLINNGQCDIKQCISNCGTCSEGTCTQCLINYQFIGDNPLCLPVCASNCNSCTTPLQCDICSNGFILTTSKNCYAIGPPPAVGTAVMQYFENGDYVVLWSQTGDNAGVYFQLYTKDGNKYGQPTKVGGNRRRLLNENVPQNFAADLLINKLVFTILWVDSSKEITVINIQNFDNTGQQLSEIIQLGSYPEMNLSTIKLPCQIKKADTNMVVAFFVRKETFDHSLMVQTYDQQLQQKSAQQIHDVNIESPPTVSYSEGIISISYSSQGYIYVQKLTKDGNLIDQPIAISDPNSLTIRTTTLKNGMIVFEWENKGTAHTLNYQLISKDLKTRSEVMGIDTKNIAELSPDVKSFNEGFISAWQIIGSEFRSPIIQFQIFNSLGGATIDIIDVIIDGLFPMNPSIQVINETLFAITCTGKKLNQDGQILGDTIFIQKFDQHGKQIIDLPSNALCGYKCENCRSPLTCFECSQGYYLNEQKQCIIDCGQYCESCSIPQVCKICKNGYNLTEAKNCQEIQCLDGYIRNEITRQCEPKCPFYCDYCKEPNTCLVCNSGYIISNNQCELLIAEDLNNREIILIVFVLIQGALLISFIVYGIFQRKKIKQIQLKLNQAQENQSPALKSSLKLDNHESESQNKP